MAAVDEFRKTIQLANQIEDQYSGKPIGRKIDSSTIFNYCESIIKKMNFYIEHASKGWYDEKPRGLDEAIKATDSFVNDDSLPFDQYVKEAERAQKAAKEAKEKFFSIRDEYANRIRTYWVRNKKDMSPEEEQKCKEAISKLNGLSYF